MLFSKALIPIVREDPSGAESASHKLCIKSGLISALSSGIFTYLPLGYRVLQNIQDIIRKHMRNAGAQEMLMPALQPLTLWESTGRDKVLSEVLLTFQDSKGRKLCLGPTHEEVATDIAKRYVNSHKQLPLVLYQIQTKFRDEIRPRFGLVRSCEFIMKDAYSFDKDEEGLDRNYAVMLESYKAIFDELGLSYVIEEAEVGAMGGSMSHEFLVPVESGEDEVFYCPQCEVSMTSDICPHCKREVETRKALEVGHIFKLLLKYSSVQEACFADESGKRKPLVMGCYGIGVSRLIPAIIEQHADQKGIIWPFSVAPYKALVLNLAVFNGEARETAQGIYNYLREHRLETLYDDRDVSAGEKFNDAYLLGIPYLIIVGKALKEGMIEIEERATGAKQKIPRDGYTHILGKVSDS